MSHSVENLIAAIATIHDHLHHNRVDAAHEACECALSGGEVAPMNVHLPDAARMHLFISEFNALAQKFKMHAASVIFLPSKTKPGAVSIQLGGSVEVCRWLESEVVGKQSKYMGDHGK